MAAINKDKTNNLVKLEEKNEKFTLQKNKLKKFSKKIPKQEDLPTVDKQGAMFGMIEYKVRQSDINHLTESIQSRMVTTNKHLVKVIKQFEEVYNTIEFLDNEYIKGILASIKAAEEANRKAVAGIKKANKHTEEIKQLVDQQRLVIQALKNFKEDIEKIKHIQDVDELYATFKPIPAKIDQLGNDVLAHENKLKQLENEASTMHTSLRKVTADVANLWATNADQERLIESVQAQQEEQFHHVDKKIDDQYEILHKEIISATEQTNEEILLLDSKFKTSLAEANNEVDKLQVATAKQEQLIESVRLQQEEQFHHVDKKIDNQYEILHKEIISAIEKANEEMLLLDSKFKASLAEVNNEVDKLQVATSKQKQLIESVQAQQEEQFLHVDKKIENQYEILHKEIISATEKTNEEMLLISSNLDKLETLLVAAKDENNRLIKDLESRFEAQMATTNEQVVTQKELINELQSSLKTTKVTMFISIFIIVVLFLLILTGVL